MSVTHRTRRRSRAGISSVILRVLPHQSPLHRAWAGSKILALTVLTITGVVLPTWMSLATLSVVTLAGFLVAGATPSAIPRLPGGVWVVCGVAAVLAWVGGAFAAFVISIGLTVLLTLLAAIGAWTTPLAELAPAMAVLWAPLGRVGLPVNEWCLTAALAIRAIPLFFDEVRILIAARRLRGREITTARGPILGITKAWASLVDVLTAVLAAAQRRANEFGRSMTLRGGVPHPAVRRPALTRADAVLLSVASGSSALMVVLGALPL